MRVFITGATGFIGQHLCRRLVERGDSVVALVRSPSKASTLPGGVDTFSGDLSVFEDARTVLPESDVVIHLAGVIAAKEPSEYDRVNHLAVKNLVECLRRQTWAPKRLVFASSLAAAGPSDLGRPWTEADAPRPTEPYGMAKAKAETALRDAPFPTTAFRPPLVLGPGDDSTFTFYRSAKWRLGFRVPGALEELSIIDVRDLVDAIVLMADDRRPGSFTYFTSHPATTNVRELWREIGRALDRIVLVPPVPKPALYATMLGMTALAKVIPFKNQLDEKQYDQIVAPAFACSSERLRSDLGWQPKHSLRETITNAVKGYREQGRL